MGRGDAEAIIDAAVASTAPVEIDPEAWERRKAARRKEALLGWGTILWSSKEGAVVLGAAIALGVGWWWLSQTSWR